MSTDRLRSASAWTISLLGVVLLLASFVPTSYDGDPEMPAFSDSEWVLLATLASASALCLITISLALAWGWKVARVLLVVPLLIGAYRLAELLPHFTG